MPDAKSPEEKEAEDRFDQTLERLVNTPHKPHALPRESGGPERPPPV
jgi:hypothetical protein